MVFPAFTLPWILYLSWPDTVHPAHFILPFAAAFGWALWIAASSFKKKPLTQENTPGHFSQYSGDFCIPPYS